MSKFYLQSTAIKVGDFTHSTPTITTLLTWIILPSLIFKLTLIAQRQLEKLSLFAWLMVRADYLAVERFRREMIYSVKMLIYDLWRSSLSDFSDEDEDPASIASDIPRLWMETDDNNNDEGGRELYCEEPPKEELPPDHSAANMMGVRRTSSRRRNVVVLP